MTRGWSGTCRPFALRWPKLVRYTMPISVTSVRLALQLVQEVLPVSVLAPVWLKLTRLERKMTNSVPNRTCRVNDNTTKIAQDWIQLVLNRPVLCFSYPFGITTLSSNRWSSRLCPHVFVHEHLLIHCNVVENNRNYWEKHQATYHTLYPKLHFFVAFARWKLLGHLNHEGSLVVFIWWMSWDVSLFKCIIQLSLIFQNQNRGVWHLSSIVCFYCGNTHWQIGAEILFSRGRRGGVHLFQNQNGNGMPEHIFLRIKMLLVDMTSNRHLFDSNELSVIFGNSVVILNKMCLQN